LRKSETKYERDWFACVALRECVLFLPNEEPKILNRIIVGHKSPEKS
jgi:hypothetical protein